MTLDICSGRSLLRWSAPSGPRLPSLLQWVDRPHCTRRNPGQVPRVGDLLRSPRGQVDPTSGPLRTHGVRHERQNDLPQERPAFRPRQQKRAYRRRQVVETFCRRFYSEGGVPRVRLGRVVTPFTFGKLPSVGSGKGEGRLSP